MALVGIAFVEDKVATCAVFPRLIFVNLEQPLNALAPIDVAAGNETSVN